MYKRQGGDIAYSSTEQSADERQFYIYESAKGESWKLTSAEKGMKTGPQMDEKNAVPTLIYGFSQWDTPDDLYSQRVCSDCREGEAITRLTNTCLLYTSRCV